MNETPSSEIFILIGQGFFEKMWRKWKTHKLCTIYAFVWMPQTPSSLIGAHHLFKTSCEISVQSVEDFSSEGGKSVKNK